MADMKTSHLSWIFEERRKIANDAINRSFDASLGLLKWVLTSVALFHSAAIVAGFNSEKFATLMLKGPIWAFLIGISLSLAAGLSFSIAGATFAGDMTNALWRGEGLDTDRNEIFDPRPTFAIYAGAAMLGLSIAAFCLGTAFAAFAITQIEMK